MTSIGQPCKTQAWMKAHVAIFLIITCGILTPSYTATSPDDSKNKTSPHQWNQQWDSPHQSVADHSTSVSSRSKFSTRSNVTASTNGSSSGLLSGLSDLNASLLTDPLHSTTGNNSVAVPITKSSDLVTTALLTAATSLPTGYKSNSSLDTQSSKNISQSYNNTLGQTPILNGSMTIALPTTTSMPAQATQAPTVANGTVSLSSISSNTVLAIVSAGEATPTPTTSTQYVYATGIPGSSGSNLSSSSASSYVNSSAGDLLPSPFSSWAGAGLAFLLLSFL
ncbi:hypothetical protein PCASD_02797 [Puccinia coronata f. sp. avenae]|uniref:Uncharacterized protein n=1 Tax=Puccinia coronata f. sp. avenae TaxID=200324 RepID=A0A2N5VFW9_9BASI|nr:hypothetical protein PCASD_02797 [Puccinia coronata f. sp. avenae]